MPIPNLSQAVTNRSAKYFRSQPLYDTVNYPAAGIQSLSFFAQPKGTSVTLTSVTGGVPGTVVKGIRDTNMALSGFMPQTDYSFTQMNIAFKQYSVASATPASAQYPYQTNMQDRELLRNNGNFRYRVEGTDIRYLPLLQVPEVNPIIGSTGTSVYASSNGYIVPAYTFGDPIVLLKQTGIEVTLEFPGLVPVTYTLDIQITLFGSKIGPLVA